MSIDHGKLLALAHEIRLAAGHAEVFGSSDISTVLVTDWAARLRALALAQPAEAVEGGEWYTDHDTGSHIADLACGKDRQLSLLMQRDGRVSFAAYANGQRFNGDATKPEFWVAIDALQSTHDSAPTEAARASPLAVLVGPGHLVASVGEIRATHCVLVKEPADDRLVLAVFGANDDHLGRIASALNFTDDAQGAVAMMRGWRNRFISAQTELNQRANGNDYELARAYAEATANEYEAALIAALEAKPHA